MQELLGFIAYLISLYEIIVIAAVIMQLLLQFNVLNYSNQFVKTIYQGLYAVTEPLLRPIRNFLPRSSGIDFAPLVLILICLFLRSVIIPNLARALG
jgi:YggT family protein